MVLNSHSHSQSVRKWLLSIFHVLSTRLGTSIPILLPNGTPLQYFCLENPMDGGARKAVVHGVTRVRHDWATSLSLFTFLHWRRKWLPTQCPCLENPRAIKSCFSLCWRPILEEIGKKIHLIVHILVSYLMVFQHICATVEQDKGTKSVFCEEEGKKYSL